MSFLDDLDAMLIEAGVDPENMEMPDEDLSQHVWMPVNLSVFGDDPYNWKCRHCGRTITIKKAYPPEPPEPDYSNITDEDEADKIREEYDKVMESYEETKESLSHMETIGEALKREHVDENCGNEVCSDVMSR